MKCILYLFVVLIVCQYCSGETSFEKEKADSFDFSYETNYEELKQTKESKIQDIDTKIGKHFSITECSARIIYLIEFHVLIFTSS